MSYVAAEARQRLLDTVAEAIEEIGVSLGALGEAYEALDDDSADRLEEALFRPVQSAYGAARRTYSGFATRSGLPDKTFAPAPEGAVAHDPRILLGRAIDAAGEADLILSELQDSLAPVEVGDPELRAGLAEVRRTLGDIAAKGHDFVGRIGR